MAAPSLSSSLTLPLCYPLQGQGSTVTRQLPPPAALRLGPEVEDNMLLFCGNSKQTLNKVSQKLK